MSQTVCPVNLVFLEGHDSWEPIVFLAGGITNCPDWQSEITKLLDPHGIHTLNPRRPSFPIGDPNAAREQIVWEYKHLRLADLILFWFPKESVCPIALYELGYWSHVHFDTVPSPWKRPNTYPFVGAHPNYPRRPDLEIQLSLINSQVKISDNLTDLANRVIEECETLRNERRNRT